MTTSVGVDVLVSLVDKITGPMRGVQSSVSGVAGRLSKALRIAVRIDTAKAMAGVKTIGRGLDDLASKSKGIALGLAAYAGTLAGIGISFVGPAAEMERFKVQLTSLEGSSAGAEKALAWINDFATKTPLELNDTVSAYARLKAFGLDPTNGSLQALVDTMAATGGGAEQLDGLVMALGQSWTKGKLQSEEALQMLERGVPVWDLLAEKLGKTSAEVQEMATKGKLGREEIMLLVSALGEKNAGASEGMSKTWGGIISNLMDTWTRFQVMVMGSGVFDYLKERLQLFLDLLNQMAADGRLQAWADLLAGHILTAMKAIWGVGEALVGMWQTVYPWLESAATMLGGWNRLIGFMAAAAYSKTLIGMAAAIGTVTKGVLLLGRALLLNPIGLIVAAIASAAYLIWQNWEPIANLFTGLAPAFGAAVDGIKALFSGDWAAAWASGRAVVEGFRSWWAGLDFTGKGAIEAAVNAILLWRDAVFQSFAPAMQSLRDAWAQVGPIFDNLGRAFGSLVSAFSGSDTVSVGMGDIASGLGTLMGLGIEALAGAIELVARGIRMVTGVVAGVLSGDWAAATAEIRDFFGWLLGNISLPSWMTDFSFAKLFEGVAAIDWRSYIPEFSWDTVITVLDWGKWIGQFAWDAVLTALDWASWIGGKLDIGGWITGIEWKTFVPDFSWAYWVAEKLNLKGWITGFEWKDVIHVLDIRNWLDFSWVDVLPDWDWGAIIPEMPDLKAMFTDAAEGLDVRLENRATSVFGDWEEGLVLIQQYRDGLIGIAEIRKAAEAQMATEAGDMFISMQTAGARDVLALLDEIEAKKTASTASMMKIETPETLREAAKAASDLMEKFPVVTAAANETLMAVQAVIAQIMTAVQGVDLTAEGSRIASSIAAGIRAQIGAVASAAAAMSAAIRSNLPGGASVNVGLSGGAAPAAGGPLQPRASGGWFKPGWLLTGENGPELEYRSEGGFIAHNRALRGMLDMAGRIGGLIGGGDGAPVPALASIAETSATARGRGNVSLSPQFNMPITLSGTSLSLQDVEAMVQRQMGAAVEMMAVEQRRSMYD